jgi:hypothetical protein
LDLRLTAAADWCGFYSRRWEFAVGALLYAFRVTNSTAPETRVDIVTPATNAPRSFALSPDGRRIAYVASGDGASHLWVRPLDSTSAQPLQGTEGAVNPFCRPTADPSDSSLAGSWNESISAVDNRKPWQSS